MRPVRILFCTLLTLLLAVSCHAAFEYPSLSARELAMGEAIAAYGNEISGWNPAHLSAVDSKRLSCTYTDLYGLGIPRMFVSTAMPVGSDSGIGFNFSKLRDEETEVVEQQMAISVGRKFSSLNLGASLSSGRFTFEEVVGRSYSLDFGCTYKIKALNLDVGCIVKDLFAASSYNTGRVEKPARRIIVGLGGLNFGYGWSLDLDSCQEIRFGVEKWVTSDVAFRAGFNRNKWSFGLTLNSKALSCDYAFIPAQVGTGHLLGITYRW
jgi:hypothetical protein